MFTLSLLQGDDGLTLREVIADIPHDAGAVAVYLLLALYIGFVWYGNRKRGA